MPSLKQLGNSDGYVDMVQRLREIRQGKGMSQNELDHRIGVTDGVVAKWESGARKPGSFLLSCWITALNAKLCVEINDETPDSLKI
jgi:ribosome-binding protein aMBF1 (putative translation factor)|tara:strand:+ start:18834 stop:19091 length:258 start_codon:yes stop_codon:yes gene_type:complete